MDNRELLFFADPTHFTLFYQFPLVVQAHAFLRSICRHLPFARNRTKTNIFWQNIVKQFLRFVKFVCFSVFHSLCKHVAICCGSAALCVNHTLCGNLSCLCGLLAECCVGGLGWLGWAGRVGLAGLSWLGLLAFGMESWARGYNLRYIQQFLEHWSYICVAYLRLCKPICIPLERYLEPRLSLHGSVFVLWCTNSAVPSCFIVPVYCSWQPSIPRNMFTNHQALNQPTWQTLSLFEISSAESSVCMYTILYKCSWHQYG